MTPHQFGPGDTAYALADMMQLTAGKPYKVTRAYLHCEVPFISFDNDEGWPDTRPARQFSPTPPKEPPMTTTPKAGDEMKVVVASAPDDKGMVLVLGSMKPVHMDALRPLPDPALTAAQLAVVEALSKHIDSFKGTYDAETWQEVLAAYEVLRALSTPPDPASLALEALRAHDAYMSEQFSGPDEKGVHPKAAENWRRVRAAIAAVVGEKK